MIKEREVLCVVANRMQYISVYTVNTYFWIAICYYPHWPNPVEVYVLTILYRFYTYGDMPLASHLEQIDREILQQFSKDKPAPAVPLEKRWQKPVSR